METSLEDKVRVGRYFKPSRNHSKFNVNISYKEVCGAGAVADIKGDQRHPVHFHSSCGRVRLD